MKLGRISKQKTGAASKKFLRVAREGLAEMSVYLAKGFSPNRGHLVINEIIYPADL